MTGDKLYLISEMNLDSEEIFLNLDEVYRYVLFKNYYNNQIISFEKDVRPGGNW